MPTDDELQEFIDEAKVHIETAEAGLLAMESDNPDEQTIHEVFRAMHSIKGTAGFFELERIVELAHAMENLLDSMREQQLPISQPLMDAMLSALDTLKEMVSAPAGSEHAEIQEHLQRLRQFDPQQRNEQQSQQEVDDLWDMWGSMLTDEAPTCGDQQNEADGQFPKLPQDPNVPQENDDHDEQINQAIRSAQEHAVTKTPVRVNPSSSETLRVSVDLLNDLLNVASEMVLGRNQLLRIADVPAGREVAGLEQIAHTINRLTTVLQEKVMRARMQPLANVFNKFPRIVRELSHKLDKEVDLEIAGDNVELDKSIIEALTDPLTHLMRNAIDHGLESPQQRENLRKPMCGKVVLKAYHEGGSVIIDVTDDGQGLDISKIKQKVLQRGLVSHNDLELMSERDILSFIFQPGFSTNETITDISGRGVGLDVVKTNIERLGGKIDIITELGAGTTFRLIMPLTLAILSTLIVTAQNCLFAIPQANMHEFVLIQPDDDRYRIEFLSRQPVLRLRDKLLPIVHLSEIMGLNSPEEMYAYFNDCSKTFRILVLKTGNQKFGLAVDAVCDDEEILVKPLPHWLKSCGYYSGVTVLGDGQVAMILDPEYIRLKAKIGATEETIAKLESQPVLGERPKEEQYVLLFQCSGTELLGLDLAMVARVEEITPDCLRKVGPHEYMTYGGQSLRVIRPEQHLPLTRQQNNPDKLYVIIPKLVSYPIGIVTEKIHDAKKGIIHMDSHGIKRKGFIGSTIMDDNMVLLLNIYELFELAAPEFYRRPVRRLRAKSGAAMTTVKRLLLVEDSVFFAKMTKAYLEAAGYTVVLAVNGRDGLEILNQQHIDLVISDIEMPVMNGLELVRAIRADERLRQLPVIALTSLTRDDQKEKGLRAGFDVYEHKLDRGNLLESVAHLLQTNDVSVSSASRIPDLPQKKKRHKRSARP